VAIAWLSTRFEVALMSHWGGFDVALGWLQAVLAAGRSFLPADEKDFPIRWIERCGDWKVATTGRLESLPYDIGSSPRLRRLEKRLVVTVYYRTWHGVGMGAVWCWYGGGLTWVAQDTAI
jgi:hypothetical protein